MASTTTTPNPPSTNKDIDVTYGNETTEPKMAFNKTLTIVVGSLCAVVVLLIGGISGASIAVAHLTVNNQLTEVDALTGIMYSKESNDDHSHKTTMKTEDVLIYSDTTNIIDMTNDQLMVLKEIILVDGDIKFQIKGYARSKDNTQIGLLVQGGTIIYETEGLATATGDAKVLLDLAYGVQEDLFNENRRQLPSGCAHACTNDDTTVAMGTSNDNRAERRL